jgi:hypothetical protein
LALGKRKSFGDSPLLIGELYTKNQAARDFISCYRHGPVWLVH